ncbi:MAG: ATP-dependent sacrificial sulfur transferase LarE [Candidatus Aureabacteria bacterium]|nr:ATP-dependent sacrificial sulfur transferase LarE [Candidatus Auribacterota bacterium]
MNGLQKKYSRLKGILASYGSLLVAYSGGVDSTLLLRVAADVLGDGVFAVTADSPTYPGVERAEAVRLARCLGVRHRVVRSDELADRRFAGNPPDRCYWCKRALIRQLRKVGREAGISTIACAGHVDDLADYRPGMRAAWEAGAVSPLSEAGFTKSDIRALSRRLGLPGWRREAMACLASRIPYGEEIDAAKLRRIERAEAILRRRGFREVRVRSHDGIARIEVTPSQIGRFFAGRERAAILRGFRKLGFLYTCVDLEGYRTGSLNLALGRLRKQG